MIVPDAIAIVTRAEPSLTNPLTDRVPELAVPTARPPLDGMDSGDAEWARRYGASGARRSVGPDLLAEIRRQVDASSAACHEISWSQRAEIAGLGPSTAFADTPVLNNMLRLVLEPASAVAQAASVLTNPDAPTGLRVVAFFSMILASIFTVPGAISLPVTAPILALVGTLISRDGLAAHLDNLRHRRLALQAREHCPANMRP